MDVHVLLLERWGDTALNMLCSSAVTPLAVFSLPAHLTAKTEVTATKKLKRLSCTVEVWQVPVGVESMDQFRRSAARFWLAAWPDQSQGPRLLNLLR